MRPLIAFRGYHATTHENDSLDGHVENSGGELSVQPYASLPKLHVAFDSAEVHADGYWYRSFEYEQERERGLDANEDLFSPFVLLADLRERSRFRFMASTEALSISKLKEYASAPDRGRSGTSPTASAGFTRSDLIPLLETAAEQFVIARGSFTSTIAGYHWFGEWGRDTMIAMPGLLLAAEHPELAKEILLQYVQYMDEGMFQTVSQTPAISRNTTRGSDLVVFRGDTAVRLVSKKRTMEIRNCKFLQISCTIP